MQEQPQPCPLLNRPIHHVFKLAVFLWTTTFAHFSFSFSCDDDVQVHEHVKDLDDLDERLSCVEDKRPIECNRVTAEKDIFLWALADSIPITFQNPYCSRLSMKVFPWTDQ